MREPRDHDGRTRPAMGAVGNGAFVISWESTGQDGDGCAIFAQRFDANGMPLDVGQ